MSVSDPGGPDVSSRSDRRRAVVEALAVAAGVVAFTGLVWLARGELGMTWDEPYFFERQYDVRDWLGRLAGGSAERQAAWGRAGLDRSWRFCRAVPDQHPPVPALLSLATGVVFEGLIGPLRAFRLSTVLIFSVAAGVLFRLVRRRWGWVPAASAVGALLFNPRLFADAQQITADVDLGAFWFLAAAAYWRSVETGRGAWLFGVLAGLAVMCKVMGVLVFPATVLWALLYRPPGWWKPLAWSVPLTPITVIALNPAFWPAPIAGLTGWVRAFLSYPQKVPVAYLGRVYDSVQTFLPWHNTLVLTATMAPIGLLVLTILGLIRLGRDPGLGAPLSDRALAAFGAIHFLTLLVLRASPFLPAHDGLRQLDPAFFFLPVVAAYAAEGLARSRLGRAAVFVCVATAGVETVWIHPFELSYYNALIGGPRGAKAAGMETTYFWDSATVEALDWMNAHLPRGATVLIFPPPNVHTFAWEQRWGRLRPDLVFLNLDPPHFGSRLALMRGPGPCYLLFQMRQGLYLPRRPGDSDRFARLAESPARYELAPARVGVRLLAVFDQEQFRAAWESPGRA